MSMPEPARGFEISEFKTRLARAQQMMNKAGLTGLLLTTEPEVGYFTGFLTRFWQSPTRPWFLIVPVAADPIAVIPSIGAQLMGKSWISDIRTWSAPNPDDDGISLLADTLREVFPPDAQIGLPMGHETSLRMPLTDFNRLSSKISPLTFTPAAGIMARLRMIKSEAEIAKISHACSIANRAFERVHEIATTDIPLDEVFRRFQVLCLEEGADWVAYLAGAAGPSGYGDVISPATGARLSPGDVLMLDTGLVHDGYFCDFDRNFAIGQTTGAAAAGHSQLMEAIDAGLSVVKPGITASAVFHAMDKIVTGGKGHSDAGRLGHGLGMQLTEWPSLIPDDHTVLKQGMVLTLEPNVQTGSNQIMVHEENIVVTTNGARLLSKLAAPQLEVL
ncbi:Metallopeptidase, family M24 [hydrothermal vent metagenome]|uniref:Metallopeptidase, family M24 n=1 Tax=hydrothermal vent metagenome TaxID=652676 RepID=A0A3B0SDW0_9ZZZZ